MLGLVAPVTMSADQQTLWLASAMDALADIRAAEVAAVSMEVRRTVTRPSQIVPEIARLVAAKRAHQATIRECEREALPPPLSRASLLDRRGRPLSEADTAELNALLAEMGATARYRPDGTRYSAAA